MVSELSQRRRDENKNKICAFEGDRLWGQRGKLSKNTVFFLVFFVGNATTIKFWKCKFYCREILPPLRRLLLSREPAMFQIGLWGEALKETKDAHTIRCKTVQTDTHHFRFTYMVAVTDFNYLRINYGLTDTDLALLSALRPGRVKFAWNFLFFTPFLTWNFGEIFRQKPKPWKT